jgi:osmotically-inducible protein OsmY
MTINARNGVATIVPLREELRFGAPAEDPTGTIGRVKTAGMERESRRLYFVGVTRFPLRERFVYERAITAADGETVRLASHWDRAEHHHPDSPEIVTLRRGIKAFGVDHAGLGRLEVVCFERESRVVTAVVIARSGRDLRIVDMKRVLHCSSKRIDTDVDIDEWSRLHRFQLDRWIREEAIDAVERDQRVKILHLRALDIIGRRNKPTIQISVQDQRVRLAGHLRDSSLAVRATALIRALPDVIAVEQEIFCDDRLDVDVADALRRQMPEADVPIHIETYLGHVDLYGADTAEAARRAEQVAARVPGVSSAHHRAGRW